MQKPTQEEIDALLECAKVVGGNFARLAAAYRDSEAERMEALQAMANALADRNKAQAAYRAMTLEVEMLERHLKEAYVLINQLYDSDTEFEEMEAMLKRHADEREALG